MHPSSLLVLLGFLSFTRADDTTANLKILKSFIGRCSGKPEMFKCLKIQSLKIMDRALHAKAIDLLEGLALVSDRRESRDSKALDETQLEKLSSEEVDDMLEDATARFLNGHSVKVNITKMAAEGRRKGGGRGGGWGALLLALAIKGAFLSMAYNGIAIMSGSALFVGKIAIILSALLGLKKLVSAGQEKTTVEIVKIPKHVESHSHSYEDDDRYRRLYDVRGKS